MQNIPKNGLFFSFKFPIATFAIVIAVLSTLPLAGAKQPPPTHDAELISIGLDGQAGSGSNYYVGSEITAAAVSADGRYVVFSSLAENLTIDDVSGWHIYLRDRAAGTTTLIADGSNSGGSPVISADGQYIAFRSLNRYLVADEDDTNGSVDIFVYERASGSIKRVSVSSDGSEGIGCSCGWPDDCNGCEPDKVNSHPSISSDGQYITFTSFSSNFVDGDLADTPDVFIHDQWAGTTTIVSCASDGTPGNDDSGEPSISADGNFITFSSEASNLVAEDLNDYQDVFLWQRTTGSMTRVSVASDGSEGNLKSTDPVISKDGNLIAFTSGADNLDSADSNGFVYDVFLHDQSKGTTSILSSSLANGASGGHWPAISSNGEYVSFTNGTNDIYLAKVKDGTWQLINTNMQFSALDEEGKTVVVSGYGALVPEDTNSDKDVYVIASEVPEENNPEFLPSLIMLLFN